MPTPLPHPAEAAPRRLEAADLSWATDLLAQALAEHPVGRYVCGTAPNAAGRRRWLLGLLLRLTIRHGRAYTNAARTALVLWRGPGSLPGFWAWQLGLLPAVLWRLGWPGARRLGRLLRTLSWLRRQSLSGGAPHHQLLAVAVRPGARGQGAGRRLLAATLALRQPAAGALPCYFGLQAPEQLAFYQGLGFELTGHCGVGQGPAGELGTWGLLLRPAA